MFNYEEVSVSGVINSRTLENGVTSTQEQPKHIESVTVTEVTGTPNNDAILEFWVETERVCEMAIVHTLLDAASSDRNWKPEIELNLDLPVGQTLKVGHVSGGTASDVRFNIKYSLTK